MVSLDIFKQKTFQLIEFSAWISNYIQCKQRDVITYTYPNLCMDEQQ